MEKVIDIAHYDEMKYQILGQESQCVQFILMPGQSIVTSGNSIQFLSEKVRVRNKFTLRERFKHFFTGPRRLDCVACNQSEAIGYVGLTQNHGKIVVIDQRARSLAYESTKSDESEEDQKEGELTQEPEEEGNFYIREQFVLAHTTNVDIVINDKFTGRNLLNKQKWYKMVTKRQMPSMFGDILNQKDTVRPLAHEEDLKECAELLFIHSQDSLIEKALGHEETIVIFKDCLVAFTDKVQIMKPSAHKGPFQKDFITIKGPGTIYFEVTREKTYAFSESFKAQELTR